MTDLRVEIHIEQQGEPKRRKPFGSVTFNLIFFALMIWLLWQIT